MNSNGNRYKFISLFIKLAIIAACFLFIYNKTFSRKDFDILKEAYQGISLNNYFFYLTIIFLLMFCNWGIETLKWKMLVSSLEKISFQHALKAVLAGITISIFTPNRAGEFGGRIFFLEKSNRIKATLATFTGSFSQLLITLVTGWIALIYYGVRNGFSGTYLFYVLLFLFLFLLLLLIYFYFNIRQLPSALLNWQWLKKMQQHFDILKQYKRDELLLIFVLSFFRYIIFSAQFYLLLKLFLVDIDFIPGVMMIALSFFAVTVIPTVTITEIAIRGSAALLFIGLLSDNSTGIITASFSLWVINIALPAIAGLPFIARLKFFQE